MLLFRRFRYKIRSHPPFVLLLFHTSKLVDWWFFSLLVVCSYLVGSVVLALTRTDDCCVLFSAGVGWFGCCWWFRSECFIRWWQHRTFSMVVSVPLTTSRFSFTQSTWFGWLLVWLCPFCIAIVVVSVFFCARICSWRFFGRLQFHCFVCCLVDAA